MAWGKRLTFATVLVMIGSAAVVEPARDPHVRAGVAWRGPGSYRSVVVQPGDHLWKISATHLEGILDRPAEPEEIDPYWRVVIEANRPRSSPAIRTSSSLVR